MRLIILLLILVSFGTQAKAQQKYVMFSMSLLEYQTDKAITKATFNFYENDTICKVYSRYDKTFKKWHFYLSPGKYYTLEILSKGKVKRFLKIDLTNVTPEEVADLKIRGACRVELFKQVKDVDYSYVQSNPFTIFYFEKDNSDLKYDAALVTAMKTEISRLVPQKK